MRVIVEWMDEEVRAYDGAEKAIVGGDRVLRIYGYEVGGRAPLISTIPLFGVREWKMEGQR